MPTGTILRVIKQLYRVPEAGSHWFGTYLRHHTDKLGIVQSTYDPCLLHTDNGPENGSEFGVVGLQTDDTLILADATFVAKEAAKLKEAWFTSK